MAKKKLTVEIAGDAKGLADTLGDSSAKLASFGKTAAIGVASVGTAAVAVGVGLFKVGASFDEAYDKIRIGTGATGDDLERFKTNVKNVFTSVPTDLGKAADAFTLLQQKTQGNGPGLEMVTKQMLELSRITKTDLTANIQASQDAFNSWGVDLAHQPGLLDEMFRASQLTGTSIADISKDIAGAQPQLAAMGFSFEKSAALAATLGKAGSSISDVMPAMSKAMATAAKEGKSASVVFGETFAKIKNAPTDTAAAGEALSVFGAKAGPKLAVMIRQGKLSFDDLLKSMQGGSDTILKAGADTQDFGEKWTLIKNRVLTALEPVAMRVFNGMGRLMDLLSPKIAVLSAWFNTHLPIAIAYLQPKAEALFGWLEEHVPPVLARIGQIITEDVVPAMQALGAWVQDNLLPALKKMAASFEENIWPILRDKVIPILQETARIIVEYILPAVGKLVTFIIGDLIPKLFEVIDVVAKVIGKVVEFGEGVYNVGSTIASALAGIVITFWRFVGDVRDTIGDVLNVFGSIADAVSAPFRAAFNFIADAWNNTVGSLSFSIPGWIPGLGGHGWSVPNIPHFDSGGMFRAPTAGGFGLAMLRDRERVSVPGQGGGGDTFIIQGSVLSERDLIGIINNAKRRGLTS